MSDEARPFVNAKLLKQKCLECACEGRHGSLQGEGLKGSWVPASEIEGLWGGGWMGGGMSLLFFVVYGLELQPLALNLRACSFEFRVWDWSWFTRSSWVAKPETQAQSLLQHWKL